MARIIRYGPHLKPDRSSPTTGYYQGRSGVGLEAQHVFGFSPYDHQTQQPGGAAP